MNCSTKKILLSFLVLCLFHWTMAQTGTGISVQGIARNAEKSALNDELMVFTFEIVGEDGTVSYYKENQDIRTDAFGVFSHIIGTGAVQAGSGTFGLIPFGQEHMQLIISVEYEGSTVVLSSGPFQYAPYAKSAENGVPTGTIVAFMGVEADVPNGWVLCDGRDLTTIPNSQNLRDLLAKNSVQSPDNAPNLQGTFLRGTGNFYSNYTGTALGTYQENALQDHDADFTTSSNGAHTHTADRETAVAGTGGDPVFTYRTLVTSTIGSQIPNQSQDESFSVSSDGAHTHTGTATYDGGGVDTRPFNYAVNYIIKL